MKAWLCRWLGIDNLWLDVTDLRGQVATLRSDMLKLERRIQLTQTPPQAHDSAKVRVLSGAQLRLRSEQLNQEAFEKEIQNGGR